MSHRHAYTVGQRINKYVNAHEDTVWSVECALHTCAHTFTRAHTHNKEKHPLEGKKQNMIFIYLITFSHCVHSKRRTLLKEAL